MSTVTLVAHLRRSSRRKWRGAVARGLRLLPAARGLRLLPARCGAAGNHTELVKAVGLIEIQHTYEHNSNTLGRLGNDGRGLLANKART